MSSAGATRTSGRRRDWVMVARQATLFSSPPRGEEGERKHRRRWPRRSLNLLLVGLEDVVEVGGDREGLALLGEVLGRDVDEEPLPGLVVELGLDRVGIDAGIPIEAL